MMSSLFTGQNRDSKKLMATLRKNLGKLKRTNNQLLKKALTWGQVANSGGNLHHFLNLICFSSKIRMIYTILC